VLVRKICLTNKCLSLWHLVWISGGFRSFSEIVALAKRVGIRSEATVSKYLRFFVEQEMAVRHSNGLYQMIGLLGLEET